MRAFRYRNGVASGVVRAPLPATARETVWAHAPTGLLFAASASGEGPYHPAVALEPGERSNLPRGTTLHALVAGYPYAVVAEEFVGGGLALVEVSDRGPSFYEEVPPEPFEFRANPDFYLVEPSPLFLGVYGLDLAREKRESGVPGWFRPNASRRKRRGAWGALRKAERERRELAQLLSFVRAREVVGHRYVSRITFATRAYPWARPVELELRLYLPAGERPTPENARDVDRVFAEIARDRAAEEYRR